MYPSVLEPLFQKLVIDDNVGPHIPTPFISLIAALGGGVNQPILCASDSKLHLPSPLIGGNNARGFSADGSLPE
jgi:hypothetical protein